MLKVFTDFRTCFTRRFELCFRLGFLAAFFGLASFFELEGVRAARCQEDEANGAQEML